MAPGSKTGKTLTMVSYYGVATSLESWCVIEEGSLLPILGQNQCSDLLL